MTVQSEVTASTSVTSTMTDAEKVIHTQTTAINEATQKELDIEAESAGVTASRRGRKKKEDAPDETSGENDASEDEADVGKDEDNGDESNKADATNGVSI